MLAEDLRALGIPVWFDEWEVMIGDSLNEKIGGALRDCGYLAIVLSKASVASDWVRKELNAALALQLEARRVFILPLLKEDCDVPVFLKDLRYADFRTDYNAGIALIVRRLQGKPPAIINTQEPAAHPMAGYRTEMSVVSGQDDLKLVDLSIKEPIYNHPVLEHSEERELDLDGPISIDPDDFVRYSSWWPVLDVKVRNTGSGVVFAKRAEFEVMRIARFKNPVDYQRQQVPVSYDYDVKLSPSMEGKSVPIDISQAIPAGGVDRFTFTVSQTGADVDSPVWYYLRLVLKSLLSKLAFEHFG